MSSSIVRPSASASTSPELCRPRPDPGRGSSPQRLRRARRIDAAHSSNDAVARKVDVDVGFSLLNSRAARVGVVVPLLVVRGVVGILVGHPRLLVDTSGLVATDSAFALLKFDHAVRSRGCPARWARRRRGPRGAGSAASTTSVGHNLIGRPMVTSRSVTIGISPVNSATEIGVGVAATAPASTTVREGHRWCRYCASNSATEIGRVLCGCLLVLSSSLASGPLVSAPCELPPCRVSVAVRMSPPRRFHQPRCRVSAESDPSRNAQGQISTLFDSESLSCSPQLPRHRPRSAAPARHSPLPTPHGQPRSS